MNCPVCKQEIDNDSLYCDQCGSQILICSLCGRPGKGKRCMFDGKELVIPGSGSSPSTAAQAAQHVPLSSSSLPVSAPSAGVSGAASGKKITLSSQNHGIVIEASEGDILGRTKGNFASILGKFPHVSGNHCQIVKTNGTWSIIDLGSTNGTFYNGVKLNPNTPAPLQNNGIIKLADIEFKITMAQAVTGGTERI